VSPITTHVLDTSRGLPAQGVGVTLEIQSAGGWRELSRRATDADGRVSDLLSDATKVEKGFYRLAFETGAYFRAQGIASFHPRVSVEFEVREPALHHHVPLLLSPFGYTTYRGS
jgi:5-hydroxyisourate hydrolase